MELSKVTLEIFTKLEQQWLYNNYDSPAVPAKARILSIDGGGTSPAVSGAALIALEDHIQAKTGDPHSRIADFFDIVAGTGVGAFYSAMIIAGDSSGRPLYSAREAVSFLRRHHPEMYKPNKTHLAGVFRRRQIFSGKSLERVLKAALRRESDGKVLTLRDTCKPILVPCFDLRTSAPFVFSRAGASESSSFDFELWKVCRATSATPSMFKPFELTSVDGKTACLAIDGGLVMNNPTAAAVTHVLHNKVDFPSINGVEDLLVLSLGNGAQSADPRRNSAVRRNGECSTATVVDIVLDGVSETVDQLVGNAFCWNRADYVRIQVNGVEGTTEEEVLKEKGVETLPFGGKRLLTETNGERIGSFVQRLVAAGKSSLPTSPCKATVSPLLDGR
ncbi:hypothetical protein V2J09_021266 [Rumex salicifolius]